jgi:hypothetical protein
MDKFLMQCSLLITLRDAENFPKKPANYGILTKEGYDLLEFILQK